MESHSDNSVGTLANLLSYNVVVERALVGKDHAIVIEVRLLLFLVWKRGRCTLDVFVLLLFALFISVVRLMILIFSKRGSRVHINFLNLLRC